MKQNVTEATHLPPARSPLRYPGGKSRAIKPILTHMPRSFAEFREPFVGGGSVFLTVRRRYPDAQVWINDLNVDVYCFWKCAQAGAHRLADAIRHIKDKTRNGRALFNEMRNAHTENLTEHERAVRFFVLNRIGFSGTVDAGGYSEAAFHERFTQSSIERLLPLGDALKGVRITNLDYTDVIAEHGNNVFVFLDPPYFVATQSRLYGRNGALHLAFDHEKFAFEIHRCPHRWLITYDDSPAIRTNFSFAHMDTWQLQYGMNNYKQNSAGKGRELFIRNYTQGDTPWPA